MHNLKGNNNTLQYPDQLNTLACTQHFIGHLIKIDDFCVFCCCLLCESVSSWNSEMKTQQSKITNEIFHILCAMRMAQWLLECRMNAIIVYYCQYVWCVIHLFIIFVWCCCCCCWIHFLFLWFSPSIQIEVQR